MPPQPTRGALIVIEGIDRAGKSTQCERLCQHLEQQGYSVRRLRFPGMNPPPPSQKKSSALPQSDLSALKSEPGS